MDKLLIIGLLLFSATKAADFIGGDGFIQLGTFRVGNIDNTHFSISSISGPQGANTVIIFRKDGTIHPGPRKDYNLNGRPLLDSPTNVRFTEHGIEFGDYWCIGMSEHDKHMSISHNNADGDGVPRTAMIWRNDGTRHGGPRKDYSCWASNARNDITVSDDKSYIQFNNAFRLGTTGPNGGKQEHLTLASDRTIVIYRDDGTIHPGPRDDWAWPNWDPDHSECGDCDDGDGCTVGHCDYSTGTAQCKYVAKDCNDGIKCTEDECIDGKCVNTPKCDNGLFCDGEEYCDEHDGECKDGVNVECPENMLCSNDDKTCVRDCNSFAIDEYLTQCSTEWGTDQDDISNLQSDLSDLTVIVNDNNDDITDRLNGIDADIQHIHNRIDGLRPYPKAQQINPMFVKNNNDGLLLISPQNYKDLLIVGLLLMNMITMIVSCYICSKSNNNKKYHVVNMQESDDEERALNK